VQAESVPHHHAERTELKGKNGSKQEFVSGIKTRIFKQTVITGITPVTIKNVKSLTNNLEYREPMGAVLYMSVNYHTSAVETPHYSSNYKPVSAIQVTLRRAQLVLGRVTVYGQVKHLGTKPPARSTQPSTLRGTVN